MINHFTAVKKIDIRCQTLHVEAYHYVRAINQTSLRVFVCETEINVGSSTNSSAFNSFRKCFDFLLVLPV